MIEEKVIEDHAKVALGMDWNTLAETIIDMELEFYELKPYMTAEEISEREQVIVIYEFIKAQVVAAISKGTDYARLIFEEDDLSDEYY